MIYPRSLYGLAVDTRRAATLAVSVLTDGIATAIWGPACRYGCGDRFHTDMAQRLHEYANHYGDRP